MSSNEQKNRFSFFINRQDPLQKAADTAVTEVLGLQQGERVHIVTNPSRDVSQISMALYDAVTAAGGEPLLMYQPLKGQLDNADEAVYRAMESEPQVVISMSQLKLGKDRRSIKNPIKHGGKSYDSTFHYLLGSGKTRGFWSPQTTVEMFSRTVPIDYPRLKREAAAVKKVLDQAAFVRIKSPEGTDLEIGLTGREAFLDDGDFGKPGRGGNLPAGESFISPSNGTARGILVFDGSISVHDGDILINKPIVAEVDKGRIISISGGEDAARLQHTINLGESKALQYEKEGLLPVGQGDVYRQNSRALGELGIGLNPFAGITGNMLEDEKAYNTCHIAIGHNYNEDAPALIHLDGLVKNPTITAVYQDGGESLILDEGRLAV